MNYNGILFGTLFELQDRILDQNTISRLLLGSDSSGEDSYNNDESQTGNELATIILKSFININVLADGIDPTEDSNRVCSENNSEEIRDAYDFYDLKVVTPTILLKRVNLTCSVDEETFGQRVGQFASTLAGGIAGGVAFGPIGAIAGAFGANKAANAVVAYQNGEYYAFYYAYIFSTIVGIFVAVIIISFTIDVAIRVFKLAILKLIAPVPIISYIDPKTQGAFQNWIKTLGLTYANVFIRLAIINFVIFFVKEFSRNGTGINVGSEYGIVRIFANLFVYLGLLMFAKEAPKFIFESIGVKKTQGLFSGLAGIAGFASSWNSGRAARRAALDKQYEENDPEKNSFKNRAKVFASGLGAGLGGAGSAYHDYTNASDNKWRTAMDKRNRENAMMRANGAAGGGFWWGRTRSQLESDWLGDNPYDRLKRMQTALEKDNEKLSQKVDKLGKLKQAGEEKAFDKNAIFKYNGHDVGFRDFETALQAAQSRGDRQFSVKDINGNVIRTMDVEEGLARRKDFQEESGRSYIQHSDRYNGGTVDQGIINMAAEADFVIDQNINSDTFKQQFKNAKIEAVNKIHENTYGRDGLNDIKDQLEVAQANLRGNDGSRGGR